MKERTFKAVIENVPAVTDFINEWLESLKCTMRAQVQIDVALDEIFSNIARHGYALGTGDARIQLSYNPENRTVSITFIDSGVAYNPLEKPDPDVTLALEKRKIGGLGVFLVKKTMDGVEYKRENGFNHLTIRKHI